MSVESGITAESRNDSLVVDGVGLPASGIRPAPDMKLEATSQLWSDGSIAGGNDRRPWPNSALPEFHIWGSNDASDNSLSSMLQRIAGEGLAGMKKTDGAGGDPMWQDGPAMLEHNGSSGLLGRSDTPWYGVRLGSNNADANSFGPIWRMPGSSSADVKPGSGDWSVSKDEPVKPEQSSGWPSNASRESEKSDHQQSSWPDLEAGAHARSASGVSDSSAEKDTDSGRALSASSPSSVDQGATVVPQRELTAEEILILQMVNSNDGWGSRPVRQDTPWVIETSSPSALAAVVSNTAPETVGAAPAKTELGPMWNAPKDMSAGSQYWAGSRIGVSSTDWGSDNDIGVWNGPPPANAAAAAMNPNMWPGSSGAASGWPGSKPAGRVNSTDLATALASGGTWADGTGNFPGSISSKLALNAARDNSLDKSRPTDAQWLAALAKPQPAGGWNSDPIPGSWGSSGDAHDLIRAQLQLGDQAGRMGMGAHQFDARPPTTALKIDTWNEPAPVHDTMLNPGHWGQPPVNSGPGMAGQAQLEAQLQQLIKFGMKREDALQKLAAASGVDTMNPSRPGTSLGDTIPLQKGRMLRGQSVSEMSCADSAALLSQLAGGLQFAGKMGMPQQGFNSAVGHRKQLSAGGGGWSPQAMGGSGAVPVQPAQNPVIVLQSLLQPKLQYRSRIQQDRMLTPQQKRAQLDAVNAEIAVLKQQIDLLQVTSNAMPAAAAAGPPVQQAQVLTDLLRSLATSGDAALTQQLLSQLKLDHGAADPDIHVKEWTGGLPSSAGPVGHFQWPPDNAGPCHMAPPGLRQDTGDAWARAGAGWNAASDRFKTAAGAGGIVGASPTWLLLNKFTYPLDAAKIQALCLQQGLLQTFFFNKQASHALACFVNRDDAISARASLGTFPFADGAQPLCSADIVTGEAASRMLNSGQWSQLSTAAGLSTVAPPPPKGRGSGNWSDAM